MARLKYVLAIVLLLLVAGICLAQDNGGAPPAGMNAPSMGSDPGMMGGPGMPPMNGPGMGMMGRGGMGMMSGPDMWPMIVRRLQLSDDEQTKLMGIYLDYQKSKIGLESQMQVDKITMMQLMMQDTIDRGKVEDTARDIGRLQGEEALAGTTALFAAKDVLSADQWHKFQSMLPMIIMSAGQHEDGQMTMRGGMGGPWMGQGRGGMAPRPGMMMPQNAPPMAPPPPDQSQDQSGPPAEPPY